MPATPSRLALLLTLASLTAAAAAAQTAAPSKAPPAPHFEVASIKPAVPLQQQINSGRVAVRGVPRAETGNRSEFHLYYDI